MTQAIKRSLALSFALNLTLLVPQVDAAGGFHVEDARDPEALMQAINADLASLAERKSVKRGLPVYTVGGGGDDCDFTDLQFAINNTPASAELRLANSGTYDSSIDLFGKSSFHIIGGYSSCGSATPTGRTVIDSGGSRVLDIWQEFGTPDSVVLANLNLTGADITGNGAGIYLEGNYHLVLDSVRVLNNATQGNGGGLFVHATSENAFVEIINFSQIAQNQVDGDGGGIYCDSDAEIILDASAIGANQATNGGGVHLQNNCLMWSFAGGPFQGILTNTAANRGGGVHVTAESAVYLLGYPAWGWGNSSYPAALHLNNAGAGGGGAYIDGTDAGILALDAMIESNQSGTSAGGVAAINGGTLIMHPAPNSLCQECSRLAGNQSEQAGGAVRLFFQGAAAISRTWVRDNTTTLNGTAPSIGGAIAADGPRETYLEGNIFTGNVGSNVVQFSAFTSTTAATLAWSTFAANQTSNAIRLFSPSNLTLEVALSSNIVWEDSGQALARAGAGTIVFDELSCLLVHESGSIPGGSLINVSDPLFVDADGGDFRLQPSSPAIDACDDRLAPQHPDFVGTPRGIPYDANAGGFGFDLGAFEMQPDAVFSDRFEL